MAALPRPSPSTSILLIGLLLLAGFYATWVWTDTLTDLGGDSAAYLIIARLYSPYHAASAATLAFKGTIISPPLFPFMLALADGGYHFLAAHLVVAAFALASVAALYFWLKREMLNTWAAAAVALLFAVLPATLFTVFNIWTEFPYLFFSLAAIVALATDKGKAPSSSAWYAAAAMTSCACLVRVAALPLLAAFLLYLLLRRPAGLVRYALLAVLPFALWEIYSSARETGAGSYVDHMVDMYSGDILGKLARQCNAEYQAVFSAWKMGWIQFSSSSELHALTAGFWYICIVGWLYRLTRLRFDALYALLYAAELALWPHPEEAARYAFVLFPVLIASGFLLLNGLPRRISRPSGKPYLLGLGAGVAILCALPAIAYDLEIFFGPIPAEIEAARHTQDWYGNRYYATVNAYFYRRLFGNLAEIDRIVAPDQCIFAIKPSLITLLSDRKGTTLPRITDSDATFNEGIGKCHYVYALPFASPSFPQMFYPMERLGGKAKIVSRIDDEAGNLDGALIEITP